MARVSTDAPEEQQEASAEEKSSIGTNLSRMMNNAARPAAGSGGNFLGVDLSGIESYTNVLIPKDTMVEGKITKAAAGKTAAGEDKIDLTLEVTFPEEFKGVKILDNINFGPKSLWKYKGLLEATELISDDGSKFIGRGLSDFEGCIVRFINDHNDYNGNTYNKPKAGFVEAFESPGLEDKRAAREGREPHIGNDGKPNWD